MYLLDTNIFVDANKMHYSMRCCPGFWMWIIHQNELGKVFSIEPVYHELIDYEDCVSDWVKDIKEALFLPADTKGTQTEYRELIMHVGALKVPDKRKMVPKYKQEVVDDFLTGADPWLIAAAKSRNATVVTSELDKPSKRDKVLIPTVCQSYGVKCLPLHAFVNELGTHLIYDPLPEQMELPFDNSPDSF